MLVDSTGQLTVAVPDTWADIDLEPDTVDGAVVPRINAATDLDVWRETFDAPGVLYAAFPYTDDEEALYRDHFELAVRMRRARKSCRTTTGHSSASGGSSPTAVRPVRPSSTSSSPARRARTSP